MKIPNFSIMIQIKHFFRCLWSKSRWPKWPQAPRRRHRYGRQNHRRTKRAGTRLELYRLFLWLRRNSNSQKLGPHSWGGNFNYYYFTRWQILASYQLAKRIFHTYLNLTAVRRQNVRSTLLDARYTVPTAFCFTAFCFISSFCFTFLSPRKWNN